MRFFLILVLTISLSQSDEIQRIESIVKDIVKLRGDYEECKKSLGSGRNFRAERLEKRVIELEVLLSKEREKNAKLESQLSEKYDSTSLNNETITKFKKLLDSKDKEIKSLKKRLTKSKQKVIKKSKKVHKKSVVRKKITKKSTNKDIQTIKPSTFRLKVDSSIYDSIDGIEIDRWEKDTTFTTNKRTTKYIKITGYFEDGKWRGAKKEMWIKSRDVYKK